MHLLSERLIEWEVVGGWVAAQARRTTHGCVHACTVMDAKEIMLDYGDYFTIY